MPAAATIRGGKEIAQKLSRLERQLAPKAIANSLNSTATKTRQQVVREAVTASKRKAKDVRRYIRFGRRARAPMNLETEVERDAPAALKAKGAVSQPFTVAKLNGLRFVRLENSTRWSAGRSRNWEPNLPIYRTKPRFRDILKRSLISAAREQMRVFFPLEFRRQLDTQIQKLRARG